MKSGYRYRNIPLVCKFLCKYFILTSTKSGKITEILFIKALSLFLTISIISISSLGFLIIFLVSPFQPILQLTWQLYQHPQDPMLLSTILLQLCLNTINLAVDFGAWTWNIYMRIAVLIVLRLEFGVGGGFNRLIKA